MQPLAQAPTTFREIVEADLRRAARLIINAQDELDPQVRIATPDGDYWIAMTLPPDEYGRKALFRCLGTFMAWRQALAFTLASEFSDPDGLMCVGVAPNERHVCVSRINRLPQPWTAANFEAIEWLPASNVDPLILQLLPTAPRVLTPKEVAAANKWFGKDGKYPAVHLPTGEVRGL